MKPIDEIAGVIVCLALIVVVGPVSVVFGYYTALSVLLFLLFVAIATGTFFRLEN